MNGTKEPESRLKEMKCQFCGDSEIDHSTSYFNESLSIFFSPITRLFQLPPDNSWLPASIYFFMRLVGRGLLAVGVMKTSTDIDKTLSIRSRVVWLEASKRNIPMEQIVLFGKHLDFYRAHIRGRWNYFLSLPIPPELSDEDTWVDDKYLLKEKLSAAGIPVPRFASVITKKGAIHAFKKFGVPVIVKPRTGSRGRHTTTYITKEDELVEAFKRAQMLNHFVLVEEFLAGSVCRATLVNGKVRGFLKADAPVVRGDGKHTVKELIDDKNKTRHPKIAEIVIREELILFIQRHGYGLNDVLPKGKVLPLLSRTGRLFGGTTHEMLPIVHPKLIEILEKAGKIVKSAVVGFDLIIEDPTRDPDNQKWGIIECNGLPFIDLHDFPLQGEPANVAKHVWDLWKK